jgi:hypothetical protein
MAVYFARFNICIKIKIDFTTNYCFEKEPKCTLQTLSETKDLASRVTLMEEIAEVCGYNTVLSVQL